MSLLNLFRKFVPTENLVERVLLEANESRRRGHHHAAYGFGFNEIEGNEGMRAMTVST